MNALSCVLFISLILLFNSFFSGRLIKRFTNELNDFLAITYGFFLFLGSLQLFIFPILAFNISPKTYLYSLLVFQIIWMLIYCLNWRYSFMPISINKRDFLLLSIGILIVFVIMFGLKSYGNLDSQNQNVIDIVNAYNLKWNSSDIFINRGSNFYLMDATNGVFSLLFNVKNPYIIYQYGWMFIFSLIIACSIYGIYFYKRNYTWWMYICYWTILIILVICSICLYTSPSNGNCWLLIGIIILFHIHIINVKKLNYTMGLININSIILTLYWLTPACIFVIVITNLFLTVLSFIYRFNNVVDYNILSLFGCVFCISMYLNMYTSIIGKIILYLVVFIYIIYLLIRQSKLVSKFLNKFTNLSVGLIKGISLGFSFIIFFVTILLITIPNDFKFDFNVWEIRYFLNKDLYHYKWLYYFVNSIYWIINVLIVIYAIVTQFIKKYQYYIESVKLSNAIIINTLTVWNPLSTNFWVPVMFNNQLAVTNSFISSFGAVFINFSYYLVNKNRWSKSLAIVSSTSGLVLISIIMLNFLIK